MPLNSFLSRAGWRISVASAVILSTSACLSATVQHLSDVRYGPNPVGEVTLFDREADLPSGSETIAVIYLPQPANPVDLATQVDGLRNEAAKLGAHAIVVREFTDPITGEEMAYGLMGTPSDQRGRVLAVRLPD